MIGVVANPSARDVVREFFELFKTPWEFYRPGGRYDVLLCSGDCEVPEETATLTVIYAGRRTPFDVQHNLEITSLKDDAGIPPLDGARIPIYREAIAFRDGSRHSLMLRCHSAGNLVVRFGYDLFEEVRSLLERGQPSANAGIPTLDLHINVLRNVIVASGIRLAEIPPVPDGYRFVACLTHDVDHPLLSRHKFDHTMFGFLCRATVGSLIQLLRGRLQLRGLLRNWAAAIKLPLVHLGVARDFWNGLERYTELEKGAASTFFVIPFEGRAGRDAPALRASRYGAADITDQMQALMSAGCEIGLHAIDAWRDTSEGQLEMEEIRRITGQRQIGARIHWLYFNEQSAANLESVGIDYDSTVGYNETIGYRAGTTQVYKPLQTRHLMELPLHVMDTALFYPSYLDLSPKEAWERVGGIIDRTIELGGCITVNWHDRSIAPERAWGNFYSDLIGELRNRGAWLVTAAQAVAWFRKRRSAKFETDQKSGEVRVKAAGANEDLPRLQVRVYNEAQSRQSAAVHAVV